MSLISKKYKNKNKEDIKNNNYSNKLIESYVCLRERKISPEITSSMKSTKKLHFGLLSKLKPKLTDIKGIHNENKLKLVNRINSFRKIYFNYYRNQGSSLKEIKTLKKENDFFSKNYKIMKEKNFENKKQYFADLKEEYEKNNYYVPAFIGNKKNLFNGNILLCNDNELQSFILYDLGSKKSNLKSLSFLDKIQNEIIKRRNIKEGKSALILNKIQENKNYLDKIMRDRKKEIRKSKSQIKKVKQTIKLIDDMDFFFNSDNQKYLDNLKNNLSRENSARLSTRVNSSMGNFDNIQFKYINNLINNNKEKAIIKTQNLYRENTNFINEHVTESNILHLNIKKKVNKSEFIKNGSLTERSNNRSIIIKNYNTKNNSRKLYDSKNLRLNPNMVSQKYNKENMRVYALEKLYGKISKKENFNTLKFNNQIKKYINSYKNNLSFESEKDINPLKINKNIENIRQIINDSNSIKNEIYLRKVSGSSLDDINKINKRNLKLKENINKIEDKIINIFCDLNNPKKLIRYIH